MTLVDAANRARTLFIDGAHRMQVDDDVRMVFVPDLVLESAGWDPVMAEGLLELLDLSTPGGELGSFSGFVDGAKLEAGPDSRVAFRYDHDTSDAEIAAVMARAIAVAESIEQDGEASPMWAALVRHRAELSTKHRAAP